MVYNCILTQFLDYVYFPPKENYWHPYSSYSMKLPQHYKSLTSLSRILASSMQNISLQFIYNLTHVLVDAVLKVREGQFCVPHLGSFIFRMDFSDMSLLLHILMNDFCKGLKRTQNSVESSFRHIRNRSNVFFF